MATDKSHETFEGQCVEIAPSSATTAQVETLRKSTTDVRSIARSIIERGGLMKASNQTMQDSMHRAGVSIDGEGDVVRTSSGVVCAKLDRLPFSGGVELVPLPVRNQVNDPLSQGI